MPDRQRTTSRSRLLIKEYRVELVALVLALLGVFLLVEPFEIRKTARLWLGSLVKSLFDFMDRIIAGVRAFTISDLLGLILLALTLTFIAWRVHYRFIHSDLMMSDACPRCGEPLHRIQRMPLDRLLESLIRVKLRRYQCSSHTCHWKGLRRPHHEDRSSHSSEEPSEPITSTK